MLRSLLLVLGVALTGSAGDTPQDSKKNEPTARVVKTKAALEAAVKGLRVRVEQAKIDVELARVHLEEMKLLGTREQIKKAYEEVRYAALKHDELATELWLTEAKLKEMQRRQVAPPPRPVNR